jgi:hypothetical protein
MSRLVAWIIFICAFGLAGCATKSVVYPEFKQPPTVSVSKETVSTATETAAEDYLIPDSQVFIAGKGGAARYLSLLGVAIDKSRNESAISGSADAFRVTFKDQLAHGLKVVSAKSSPWGQAPALVETGGEILMLPAARLVMRDDESSADLSFRVTVRFKDVAGDAGRKNYWYPYGVRPLAGNGGWADQNAALFKTAADQAMTRLAQVIVEDVGGAYRKNIEPGNQRTIRWRSLTNERVVSGVLLKEEADYLVVVPLLNERLVTGVVLTIPKEIVRPPP